MLGHYHLRGEEMDEPIALFFRAPHSYTGEDVIELSVHGGNAMAQGLLEALYLAGAAPAGPGEFTRRALENGRMSLTQAEAVMEIISAEGRQGAALAKSALDGALARRIAGIQAALQTLAAHLTAWIDYPEEDVPEVSQAELIATLSEQRDTLDQLIAGYGAVGEHGDAVEAEGIRRSWKKLEEAGLVLAVFDLAAPLNEEDLEIARRCQGRPALAILNKQDLAGQGETFTAAQQQLAPYFKAIIPLTARDAASLQPLCQAVAQLLGTANLDPNAAALCSARQLSAAKEARDALAEALNSQEDGFGLDAAGVCISDAQRALARLTGEDATEATIDEVFSTFCVGK